MLCHLAFVIIALHLIFCYRKCERSWHLSTSHDSVNKASGRTVYSGSFKACAKEVSDAACGGQVLLSRVIIFRIHEFP